MITKYNSVFILTVFTILTLLIWDFDIQWYFKLLVGYIITSVIQGVYYLYLNSQKPPTEYWVFWTGFLWLPTAVIMLANWNVRSDHNRTIGDHK